MEYRPSVLVPPRVKSRRPWHFSLRTFLLVAIFAPPLLAIAWAAVQWALVWPFLPKQDDFPYRGEEYLDEGETWLDFNREQSRHWSKEDRAANPGRPP
jgi:hypothetical protein